MVVMEFMATIMVDMMVMGVMKVIDMERDPLMPRL